MASNLSAIKKTGLGRPSLAPQSMTVDIDRALSQLNTAFNPLHQDFALDFHVSGAKNGYVYLSIALPEGMTRFFVQLLESMHGFFQCMDIKARSAVAIKNAVDPSAIAEAEDRHKSFKERVCSLFDAFRGQGMESKAAISRTNEALKAENCPWATYETVVGVLRGSGRFRKQARSKQRNDSEAVPERGSAVLNAQAPSNPQGGEISGAESVSLKTKGGPASSLGVGQDEAG